MMASARAQPVEGDIFTVANYPVQAEAKDAVTAKQQALSSGQEAAFSSLLRRLVPVTRYAALRSLPKDKASDYLDGVAITNERNSRTFYEANLNLTFREEPIRKLLDEAGIPFVDDQSKPVTVVLLYQPPREQVGSPEYGAAQGDELWRSVWRGLDLKNSLSPVKLESLRPGIGSETIDSLTAQRSDGVQALASAYGVPLVVLAAIRPEPSRGRLTLRLAGQDAVGPFAITRDLRFAPADFAYTVELAAVISMGILEGRWKAVSEPAGMVSVSAEPGAGSGNIQVLVQFGSLADWNRLRGTIETTPGVRNVEINGLSTRNAVINLTFRGGAAAFSEAIAGQGLSVSSTPDGNLVVQ